MDYIKRIRALREDNDYTQREIAALLNVGQRTYADYEYGKTRIPLESMIKLAKFYNVDMNYICGVSHMKVHFPNKKGK
ncbi:helix-turn-helix domain-containing protein [Enterococcus sp. AZ101]|uniref:helix-turn-helix domain-containing protein n=1 Tax=Enterococcus sp. AZ101 TaxID=2774742 RepID=UPI003D270E22